MITPGHGWLVGVVVVVVVVASVVVVVAGSVVVVVAAVVVVVAGSVVVVVLVDVVVLDAGVVVPVVVVVSGVEDPTVDGTHRSPDPESRMAVTPARLLGDLARRSTTMRRWSRSWRRCPRDAKVRRLDDRHVEAIVDAYSESGGSNRASLSLG